MKFISRIILAVLGLVLSAQGAGLDFNQWGLVAIQEGGRRKPIDTFAKESLLRLSGRDEFKTKDKTWAPNDFVLSMLLDTHDWRKEPLILVGYRPLVQELGLDAERKRFSLEELAAVPQLMTLAQQGHELEKAGKDVPRLQKEAESVIGRLNMFSRLADGSAFTIVPAPSGPWTVPGNSNDAFPEDQYKAATGELATVANGYISSDNFNFNLHANRLRASFRQLAPSVYPTETALKLEYFYNHLHAFDWAALLYGSALVFLAIANARPRASAARLIGLTGAIAGLAFHAGGIALRCVIAGRPPVTNMFESVVWVSFGVLAFGFIFFARYRTVTYLLAALPVSLLCLLLLRQIPAAMPESIDPLVPVLRSNFWLTIHVLTITLSYAAFGLAMGFGHIVLYRFIRNPAAAAENQSLHFWLYRVVQLGVLLLGAGTILGGVWANYSWGRFWGWDPKETWALIAFLCYIFVIHGRLAGWWDQFGMAIASVICFCAVVMTWYGVNFVLGKGLHSYGFGIGGERYVAAFVVLDLCYVALAALRYRSLRVRATGPAYPGDEPVPAAGLDKPVR